MKSSFRLPLILSLVLIIYYSAEAKIVRIVITKTEAYSEGRSFGNTGAYEKLYGQAYGEIDPGNPLNSIIQDIRLAPRNGRGMVEYVSEFILLKPKDTGRCNGLLFLSLPNRGNVFPADTALLKRGYIYLWSAWQGDVLEGNNRLMIRVPVATENGKEIVGRLRTEYHVIASAPTLNLSSGFFNGLTHHSYETASLDNTGLTLTKRVHESDPRVAIPNNEWAFSDCRTVAFPGTPSTTMLSLKGGFDPDYIYELIYPAKNPLVLGLGFAAIRDIASFFRNEINDASGNTNPLLHDRIPVRAAILQGVSQCSNFTRTFLNLGFNQDENGKQVFEGVNAHIGTRRISLNIRFGRPGGGGLQHEDHLFPSNDPPFTWDSQYEPVSKITGGILERCAVTGNCPKIIQTLSASEYWQLRASLTTTSPDGSKDLTIPSNVRIYFFAGTQHSPYGITDKMSGLTTNHNSYYPMLRALLIALEKWVIENKEPPPSTYPTIASKTLVPPDKKSTGWPDIPGIRYNGKVNDVPLLDFGMSYQGRYVTGVLQEPPKILVQNAYRVLIPKVDIDGNEIGGIRNVTMRVPLGTYTGWSLRQPGFGEGDMAALSGMFIPFKNTKKERLAAADPRLSLEERYRTRKAYIEAVKKAAKELVQLGFLLPEDAAEEISNAEKSDILKN